VGTYHCKISLPVSVAKIGTVADETQGEGSKTSINSYVQWAVS
jgi:hypothetical protein